MPPFYAGRLVRLQKNTHRHQNEMPARIRGCALFFSDQIHDITELLSDIIIIAAFVRHQTGGEVLDSIFQNLEIAPAILTQRIQRAIAEQAIKIFHIFVS